jgi:glucose/arabinose dehydrogenase
MLGGMRHIALVAAAMALVVACSSKKANNSTVDSPWVPPDGACLANNPVTPITACTPVLGMTVSTRMIGSVDGGAILATSPPNDGRLFVIQQSGQIRIFENEVIKPDAFLDLDGIVLAEAPPGERGLLGLAFHPNYACNGFFYVYYTTATADVVERFQVSATDPDTADPNSGTIILSIPDPFENHNGGMMQFGTDGYLYIGTGDGGSQEDPRKNGQAILRTDPTCVANQCEPLLAKILRIDVDNPASSTQLYGIPATNPYAAGGVGEPEILIRGVRNPWRWSFDSMTGDLYIGDVGQDTYEEVDVIPAANIVGPPNTPVNLGWSMYEANACYQDGNGNGPCDATNMTFPEFVRDHNNDNWHAVIGGAVYRGSCYPGIVGNYYFSDNTFGQLTQGIYNPMAGAGSRLTTVLLAPPATTAFPNSPSSIHADASGEIYITDTTGGVWHIEASP